MKKLFISMIAVAFSLSAMAASTAAVRITLVGSNTTYAVNTLYLNEDDARNSSYESGYDSESMMSQSNAFSVLLYGFVGSRPCERVETNNLDGQIIGFTTNKVDANYTLQFSNVSGRALQLYDRVEKKTIDITEGLVYEFSVAEEQVGQIAINNRFFINPQPQHFDIFFEGKDGDLLDKDGVALFVPVAPEIEDFIFKGWFTVAGPIEDGIVLQAVYESTEPTSAPEVVVNPANPSQKLVRNGQVYILRDEATYTLQGQMVK